VGTLNNPRFHWFNPLRRGKGRGMGREGKGVGGKGKRREGKRREGKGSGVEWRGGIGVLRGVHIHYKLIATLLPRLHCGKPDVC